MKMNGTISTTVAVNGFEGVLYSGDGTKNKVMIIMDDVTMMTTFGWKDLDTAKAYIRKARTKSAQKEAIEQIVDFA